MSRKISSLLIAIAVFCWPAIASAHVVVTPAQVGIGSSTTFTISVPNEKDTAVTNIKLVLPVGLSEVTPTVKSGWAITTEKSGSDSPTSIQWAGGTIPIGLRDDFSFSAQVPAKATSLNWKAYQTYADGSTVHWDQTPAGSDDSVGNAGPYSSTKVIDDLSATSMRMSNDQPNSSSDLLALLLAGLALLISFGSLLFRRNKLS